MLKAHFQQFMTVFDDFFDDYLTGGGGGKIRPPPVFLHHPKTAQEIKLKLSDFKDTPLRHTSQTSSLNFELLPWQQNYRSYLAGFGCKET